MSGATIRDISPADAPRILEMQEDAQAGMIYAFLEDYTGDRVCSKQLYQQLRFMAGIWIFNEYYLLKKEASASYL